MVPRLAPLSWPLRALAVSCWLFAAAASCALLLPGVIPVASEAGVRGLGVLVLGAAACTAAAATAAGLELASCGGRPGGVRALGVAVWVAGLVPVAALFAERVWPFALAAGALHAVTGAALALVPRSTRSRHKVPATVLAAVAAGPWVIALLQGLTLTNGFAASLSPPLSRLAVIAVSFGAFLAVARVAEARHAIARRWLPADAGVSVVLAVLAVKVVVVWLRLTWARGLFGQIDRRLWTLRDVPSWPHAVLVAVLMLMLVARTQRAPRRPDGQRLVTYVLVVAAASVPMAELVDLLLGMTAEAFTGRFTVVSITFDRSHWLALAAAVGLSVLLVAPRFAGSAGRTLAAAAVVYLGPPVTAIALLEEDPSLDLPALWASAVQVDIALTVAVALTFGLGLLSQRVWIDHALAVRLLVIPTLAVHAGVALPDAWSAPLGRPLVVLAALAALIIPAAGVDRSRPARAVLAGSALQLALLVTYLLAANQGFADTERSALLGVLWLAVPVSTVLCCRLATSHEE